MTVCNDCFEYNFEKLHAKALQLELMSVLFKLGASLGLCEEEVNDLSSQVDNIIVKLIEADDKRQLIHEEPPVKEKM
jgi:hypothetical protein